MVWLCQAKAAQDFSTSCSTSKQTSTEIKVLEVHCVMPDTEMTPLTKPGQVLLLLSLCAVSIDWMHDQ